MPNRLTKIMTRKGDQGYTTLGDARLSKDDLIIEALGNLDELNSAIGFTVTLDAEQSEVKSCLQKIQQDLFDFGGELHAPDHPAITPEKIVWLETQLEQWNSTLPPLKEFLVPGGSPASAACHVARTVCRRAERSFVKLHRQVTLPNPEMLRYLNRLSDLLFVASRVIARKARQEEKMWEREE